MAIVSYKDYKQPDDSIVFKVFLADTNTYKDRFFYVSVPSPEDCLSRVNKTQQQLLDDIQTLFDSDKYIWHMISDGRIQGIVKSSINSSNNESVYLTRELFKIYFSNKLTKDNVINIVNKVNYDCRDANLNVVSKSQVLLSQESQGYTFVDGLFRSRVIVGGIVYSGISCESETDACILQYNHEVVTVKKSNINSSTNTDGYKYNILNDFSGFENILDDMITLKISENDAKLKLVDSQRKHPYLSVPNTIRTNAWYIFRYNLFDFFIENKIDIPKYKLNKEGRMIHPETGELLCPF